MKGKFKQSGVTLMEMTVVIGTVALLTALSMPAARTFFNSLGSAGGTKAMIGAALSASRATAIKEHRYAGIRFQKAYRSEGPLNAPQYMIFVVNEEPKKIGNLTIGFRAVEGLKPIKLPDTIGVMDLKLGTDGDVDVLSDTDISDPWQITDTTAFSIIFSPSGKLVAHDVRVRNRDGKTEGTETLNKSKDDIFNTLTKITDTDNPFGMLVQDDYQDEGLYRESSRTSFIIYDRVKFKEAYDEGQAWTGHLESLVSKTVYINPYTGTIIER
jgi:type II secretory pathway pseudopilin PulG